MTPDVGLRTATLADAEALVALHEACWREAYDGLLPDTVIASVFADPVAQAERRREQVASGRATWLAETPAGLVGFASAGPGRHDDAPAATELYALYVRAARWGAGVGHRLLVAAVGNLPAYLWVLDGNVRAAHFYERQGFAFDGAEDDAVDARHLRMVRPAP